MRLIILVLLTSLGVSPSIAHDRNSKEECSIVKAKIRHIHSKMRDGYTRAQGERLEAKLRKLRKVRQKKC